MTGTDPSSRPSVYFHRGKGSHSWAQAVIDGFHDAFVQLGYASHTLIGDDDPAANRFREAAQSGEEVWLIDLNARMRVPPGYDGIRKFSIIVDHPFLRTEDLAAARPGDTLGLCDQSHLSALPPVRQDLNGVFLPHAGPSPTRTMIPMRERAFPILFAGSLPAFPGTGHWRDHNPDVPEDIAAIIIGAAEAVVSHAHPTLHALQQAAQDQARDPFTEFSAATLITFVQQIEQLAEQISRSAMLLALRDLPVRLIAPGVPEFLKPLPEQWVFAGECSADELLAQMADTKIVLNPVVKFPYGAHDRVFNAQSQGAIAATPFSHFLDQDYTDDQSILFVDPEKDARGTSDRLGALLSDDQAMQSMAQSATEIYQDRHTWLRRAASIADSMAGA